MEPCGTSPSPAIVASELSRTFYTKKRIVTALENVSLKIEAGGMAAFVGPDGAGKTTLLRMICGLLRPTSGSLSVLGFDSTRDAQKIQDRISYMPQRFGLYEDLTVHENMNLYADLHGVGKDVRNERFARLLEMTDLSRFTSRPAGKLSGGMKQKLALACTLVRSPDLLLLDEPSVGVDPLSRRDLWKIITRMVEEESLTVIVSTSYMDEAARCGRVFVMNSGQILAQGSPDELRAFTAGRCRSHPSPTGVRIRQFQSWLLDQTSAVMDAVPEGGGVRFVLTEGPGLPRCLTQGGTYSLTEKNCKEEESRLEDSFMYLLKRHAVETDICKGATLSLDRKSEGQTEAKKNMQAGSPNVFSPDEAEVVIEVRDLVRKFGNFTAVDKTTFDVRRGEVFGLLGPNGAGKTTTFRMLCGLLPATSGHLLVAGENLRTAAAQARAKVGYVSQKFSLYGNLSVLENLRFFGGAYGLGPLALSRRINEILDQFNLSGHEDELSGAMPGGFKQRLAMAVGLLHRPEILFLDEPTSGIDALARRMFWRSITELSESGTTVIITTHFMEEAEYCDRMLIQDAGKVLALGTPSEVRGLGCGTTMEEAFINIVEQARAARNGREVKPS